MVASRDVMICNTDKQTIITDKQTTIFPGQQQQMLQPSYVIPYNQATLYNTARLMGHQISVC